MKGKLNMVSLNSTAEDS